MELRHEFVKAYRERYPKGQRSWGFRVGRLSVRLYDKQKRGVTHPLYGRNTLVALTMSATLLGFLFEVRWFTPEHYRRRLWQWEPPYVKRWGV